MVNKCSVVDCKSNYAGHESTTAFYFPAYEDLKMRWIKFVNRRDFVPSTKKNT